jgi:hypothetical protein
MKLARNDPCSCGSGKKYKHCCQHLSVVQTQPPIQAKAHDGAIEKSMAWLGTHQRKGWQVAFSRLMEELLDERDREAVSKLDEETIAGIQINLTEWLLAEGSILVKGVSRRVADYLIGPFGPAMTPGQRDWIQQMSQRPLRLYSVTDVRPGEHMTLCDALDGDAKPVVVLERSGSQSIHPGNFIGARIMRVEDHFELSGAAYPFSMMAGPPAANRLRDTASAYGHLGELAQKQALVLMSNWLQQYVSPARMPTMMDLYSGEPIVSITDHYRVLDWNVLTRALQDCADIEGDRSNGWTRIMDCEDGQRRPFLSINTSKKPDQVEVFYKTQAYADQGRVWLEGLAGAALAILTRKISDQASWAQGRKKSGSAGAGPPSMPDIDPQELTKVVAGVIQRTYANWCDESIPALDNKTPRQAIQSTAGMERVKGLLRSYEFSEKEQARQQGRAEVSYDFLWAAIGLSR